MKGYPKTGCSVRVVGVQLNADRCFSLAQRDRIAHVKESKAFEQQIHRIYELLESTDAKVTWNDHLPDPDNPSRPRQIDITIRRNGQLALVECRHHRSPQDVQWIEALMGRRISLGADAIIAVSSSSFTAGALKKAKAHGIILRDLQKLTEPEIKSWGQRVTLTLYFYQYSDLEVSLCFDRESITKLENNVVRLELESHPAMQSLFSAAAQQLGTLNLISGVHGAAAAVTFGLRIELAGFYLLGERVLEVDFRGKARLISKKVTSPAVFAYGEPKRNMSERVANIERFSLGKTSIVHDAGRISVFLDVSQEKMPPFCQFRSFKLSAENEMDHDSIEFVGIDKLWVHGSGLKVNICSRGS